MTRFFATLFFSLFISVCAQANTESTLLQWQMVQDPNSGSTFEEIADFLENHSHWPDQQRIRVRAEYAMRGAYLSDNEIIAWYGEHYPVSGMGKFLYSEALERQGMTPPDSLVKEAWIEADLSADEESRFLDMFSRTLGTQEHIARADRLLWDSRTTAARRMLPYLPPEYQSLVQARAALIDDEKAAPTLVGEVSRNLSDDSGFLYDRMRWRAKRGDSAGVRDILLSVPNDVAYPQRWWKIRESEVRDAIDEGDYKMASRLLENYGQLDGAEYAEALWLDGWLKLEYLNKPDEAYSVFQTMHGAVKTPVSRARAAYWAGRSASKMGDSASAGKWFREASEHSTTFYGQLALTELDRNGTLSLPSEPSLSRFSSSKALPADIVEAIKICLRNDDPKLAARLVNHLIATNEDNDEAILAAAALGNQLKAPQISVKAAKKAQMKGVVLRDVGYPRPKTDQGLPIERPLTLAITRQESEYDPRAKSPAGAVGMMQLLPGTAKDTAKKISEPYRKDDLTSPSYNMLLGSHYLSRMINAYDGSYVMAIAAYNAGPGNVRKWMTRFDTPGGDVYSAINWIEKIPFAETRNYVQRVMENLQVYRALEGDDRLRINEDLTK